MIVMIAYNYWLCNKAEWPVS